VVDAVSTAFSDSISDAVKSKTIAKSATQIADEISASYPFHPSFKHILALFKENERFRQTRGLMTVAALMVKSALNRPSNEVYLVGCQHIDLSQPDVRDVITNVYDLSGAIAHDIAGTGTERAHAQTIDDQTDTDAASQVARLVLLSSRRRRVTPSRD
jgi:predicted AAA+ superfamily ATPase